MTERSQQLERFNLVERIVHWLVGLTFVLLLVTGLAFSYPSLFWMTVALGGGPMARALHPWIGLVFTLGTVYMFFLWVKDMYLDSTDRAWLRAVKHYARHEREHVPPTGKYNGGQKLFFWIQSMLAVLFLVSGIILWFPSSFGPLLLTAMRLVHYLAALAGGLLLIVHMYLGTIAYPGTARAMLHGTVTPGWAKLHHPLWYKEKTRG